MGLFSKKETIIVDADAFSINGLAEAGISGEAYVYLETADGYITREEYLPENMDKVIAFVIGKSKDGRTCDTRIPLEEVTDSHIHPIGEQEDLGRKIARIKNLAGLRRFKFSTAKKDYSFDCYDTIDEDEISRIFETYETDEEKALKLYEESCIWALSAKLHSKE